MEKWKVLFASGNPTILQSLRERFDDDGVSFTDDYNVIKAISQCEEDVWVIVTLADSKMPLKNAGSAKGFFFNEMRKIFPGEFISDIFTRSDLEPPYDSLQRQIDEYKFVEDILQKLESGEYKIRYREWVFMGGREPDMHTFTLYDESGVIGQLSLSDEEVYCRTQSGSGSVGSGWCARTNHHLVSVAESIITKALERDDKEFFDACVDPESEEWQLPCGDFCGITREAYLASHPYTEAPQEEFVMMDSV